MKYPFFASFIIFILVVRHAIRKGRNDAETTEKQFWARERQANEVRRKPLDDLIFIRIPMSELPTDVMEEDAVVRDCLNYLSELSKSKIVNLTGLSNTDLKLTYGVANLPLLTEYDNNFTLLVQTLNRWCDTLWENGYTEEAACIAEYAVSVHADNSSFYKKLAIYYKNTNQNARINELKSIAEQLNSASRNAILRALNDYMEN